MKISTEKKQVETSGFDHAPRQFAIQQNARAFEILSSNIYSDRPLAVVREYGCNALDSHIAAGKADVPFEVHLPNQFEPWFAIKDFGLGMSHDSIMDLYTTYFKSTKADSNDFVGAMGLGSKSAFAYTDQFSITSRFNGVVSFYSAYVEEDGAPNITLIKKEPTDECNGVEISMSVKQSDFSTFAERVKTVFARFATTPIITGNTSVVIEPLEYGLTGPNYRLRESSNKYTPNRKCYAIQGPVAYPINSSSLENCPEDVKRFIEQCPVDILFPMGDVNITASREQLNYDKRTQKNIIEAVTKVLQHVPEHFQKEFAAAKTLWEAKMLHASYIGGNEYGSTFANFIKDRLFWNGLNVKNSYFPIITFDMVPKLDEQGQPMTSTYHDGTPYNVEKREDFGLIYNYSQSELGKENPRVSGTIEEERIFVEEDTQFVFMDTKPRSINSFIKHNYQNATHRVIVFDVPAERRQDILDQLGNPPDDQVKLSSQLRELPKIERVKRDTPITAPIVKTLYRIKPHSSGTFWSHDVTKDVREGGYYIMMWSRTPVKPGKEATAAAWSDCDNKGHTIKAMAAMKEAGLFTERNPVDGQGVERTLFGVNSTYKKLVLDNPLWINAFDHTLNSVKKILANKKLMLRMFEMRNLIHKDEEVMRHIVKMEDKELQQLSPGSTMRKLRKRLDTLMDDIIDGVDFLNNVKSEKYWIVKQFVNGFFEAAGALSNGSYLDVSTLDLTQGENYSDNFVKEVLSRYPMLDKMLHSRAYMITSSELLHYVQLADASPKLTNDYMTNQKG